MVEKTTPGAIRPLLGMRLLVVEDAWVAADLLTMQMEEAGANVQGPFATTAKAIEFLQQEPADFALIDLNLADGFADDLVDALVERDVPYAILTGYRALPTNADEHAVASLKKPYDADELIGILGRHVKIKPDV